MIDTHRIGRIILTLAVAAAGGMTFGLLNLPAGWMTGAMIAVAIAGVAGMKIETSLSLRNVAFVAIGVFLGSTVSPDLVGRIHNWPISLAGLVLNVLAVQWAAQWFLVRVCRWDRLTAFFAAIPGLTSYVIALALPTRADTARVAMSQTIRVLLLVLIAPNLLSMVEVAAPGTAMPAASPSDMALMVLGGAAGGVAFSYLRVPSAPMLGAMFVSGLLHGTGLVHGGLPSILQILAFIALGALVGSRFRGVSLAMLRTTFVASLGSFVAAVAVSVVGAWLAATATGLSFGQMVLAFAPGGIDVMAAMALALHLDTAFVAAHQLVRFLVITVYAPIVLRKMQGRPGDSPDARNE